jgi:hypothetical protein
LQESKHFSTPALVGVVLQASFPVGFLENRSIRTVHIQQLVEVDKCILGLLRELQQLLCSNFIATYCWASISATRGQSFDLSAAGRRRAAARFLSSEELCSMVSLGFDVNGCGGVALELVPALHSKEPARMLPAGNHRLGFPGS